MTCLLAVEKDGTIYYAGDRCESSGYLRHELAHAKWIAHRDWRIGVAGPSRIGTLMTVNAGWRDALSHASEAQTGDVFRFAQAIKGAIDAEGGWANGDEKPPTYRLGFIVAGPVGLFIIRSSFDVFEVPIGHLAAVGVGDEITIGAWYAMAATEGKTHRPTKDKLRICLEVAAARVSGISPPFDFGELPTIQDDRRRRIFHS